LFIDTICLFFDCVKHDLVYDNDDALF